MANEVKTPIVFKRFATVIHVKSGKVYSIKGTPAEGYRLESNNQPAYCYQAAGGNEIWVRAASEFEDGRFQPYP